MLNAKASQLPLFTTNENPKDAVVTSHKLLSRAGYIKKQSSGFYVYLPFGNLVYQKLEQIIREEMNESHAVEVKLPILTDSELWMKSARWDSMGKEMMRMKDRHDYQYVLGPTHEESMSWLAANFLQSYKQLPVNFYQIGTKYRDEIRPRYGLIRCREFVMKDAYSFHADDQSLNETYDLMRQTYKNIFLRCELDTLSVEADSGAMGGSGSEEFMVASEIGEETLLLCEDSTIHYRANQEKAEYIPAVPYTYETSFHLPEKKLTIGKKSVEEVAAFLEVNIRNFIKTVIFENPDSIVIAFIPGDREINEVKLSKITGLRELEMAEESTVVTVTKSEIGYAGPYMLPVENKKKVIVQNKEKTVHIVYDRNLRKRGNLVTGANEKNYHFLNVQEGRDFIIPEEQNHYDIIKARAGDLTPGYNDKKLVATKGIEVGHIFKLGKKYTESFNIKVLDKNGKSFTPTMGTYGIGLGRTIATVVEQKSDEKGIIWPESLSPFKYYMVSIYKNDEQKKVFDQLYNELVSHKISVYYDDRNESPGVKFTDADLTGFPYQLVVGKNFIADGTIELKNRKKGEKSNITIKDIIENNV